MPLRQLYPPSNAETDGNNVPKVDIIAVHGLNPRSKNDTDHAWDTWRKPLGPEGRLWLRDDLPKCVPNSRIFLYEYNSTAVYGKDRSTFSDRANELLEAIRIKRDDLELRPIVLIGHSLGGLLIKQALINAHNNSKYTHIKDATTGLAFFATPHRGGNEMLVSIGGVAARIAHTLGFQKGDNLIKVLEDGNIFTDLMQEHWRHQLMKYDIISFWGAFDNIVPRESSRFGIPGDRENIVKLNADHSGVCKFGSDQDDQDNLELVEGNIRDLCKNALTIVSNQRKPASEECRNVADWLTPDEYGPIQSDFFNRRQTGTGQWLLDSPEFQEWLSTKDKTLFCPGIPGAGKTILTSIVVQELHNKFENTSNVGIAYIYCNFKRTHEQTLHNLLASLLKQLLREHSSLTDSVRSLYSKHKNKRTLPSIDEILKALHSVISSFSTVFIIIDALDECCTSDGTQDRFISEILNLQRTCKANLFTTSRSISNIVESFKDATTLEISASNGDIRSYLEGHMSMLPKCVSKSYDLQEEIKTTIIKAVGGMFLLARMHLDSLKDKPTPKAIKKALEQLPEGSDALDEAYEEATRRIDGQDAGFKKEAWRVISWITCARRPLASIELQHALAVEAGDPELDQDKFLDIDEIVAKCAGLVTIDEKSTVIRLVHYTTQEYFQRTQKHWFPDAESDITMSCVTYLSFDIFERMRWYNTERRSHRFFGYASRNWISHALQISSPSKQLNQAMRALFQSEGRLKFFCKEIHDERFRFNDNSKQLGITILHFAAFYGIETLAKEFLFETEAQDTNGQTPLHWAVEKGHIEVAKLIFDKNKAIAEVQDKDSYTPLHLAVRHRRTAIVEAMAEVQDEDGCTPLHLTSQYGQTDIFKMLLDKYNAKAEAQDKNGKMPLHWASQYGRTAIVEVLLDKYNAKAEAQDKNGKTPLHWASQYGRTAIVEVLLDKSIAIAEARDKDSHTPLYLAVQSKKTDVIKLLLNRSNAIAKAQGNNTEIALYHAAFYGHTTTFELLLNSRMFESWKKDIQDLKLLSLAAEKGHVDIVKLLLNTPEVDVNTGLPANTPLYLAVLKGHTEVVKLLLDTGKVETNHMKYVYDHALLQTIEQEREAIAELLLKIQVDLKDSLCQEVLLRAVEAGCTGVVQVLRDTGRAKAYHTGAQVGRGRTLLSFAAEFGYGAIVQLLLEIGADADKKDKWTRTPLHLAAKHGHADIVQSLLKKGAKTNIKTDIGLTPLQVATNLKRTAVVQLLQGIDESKSTH